MSPNVMHRLHECTVIMDHQTMATFPWSHEIFLRVAEYLAELHNDWYQITDLDLIEEPESMFPTERIRIVTDPRTGRRKLWIGPGYDQWF